MIKNTLFNLIFLVIGFWIIIFGFWLDIDFFKINSIEQKIRQIKDNTRISILIFAIGLTLTYISKIIILVPATLVFSFLIPGILLRQKKSKIQDKKMQQWIVFIDDLSSSIRAGFTLSEGLLQALSNSDDPLKSDFHEAIFEFQRSGEISKVMEILRKEIKDAVGVSALRILSVVLKTGANDLASSLTILSNSSRETLNLIQDLKAKQSWVINGARISIIAPWLILLVLWTQENVRLAYQNLTGQFILILVAIVGAVGYSAMKRIGKLEFMRNVELS